MVFYEDLTARPDETLRAVVEGLGLDWEPEILERYGSVAGGLVTGEETWKAGVERPIARSGTAHRALTGEERDRARGTLRPGLYEQIRERVAR